MTKIILKTDWGIIPFNLDRELLEVEEHTDGSCSIVLKNKETGGYDTTLKVYASQSDAEAALDSIWAQIKAGVDGGNVIIIIEDL